MLSVLQKSMSWTTTVVKLSRRTYATTISHNRVHKRPHPETPQPEGPLRPHLNVQVNPDHGLYAFFRKRTKENSYKPPVEDGSVEYVALEQPMEIASGRAWQSVELRRKSFKDLHTLWYILLRERNLIETQKGELRRFRAHVSPAVKGYTRECRLSMARVKQNLTERSKAYMQAAYLRRQLRMKNAPVLDSTAGKLTPAQIKEPIVPNRRHSVLEESMLEPLEAKS